MLHKLKLIPTEASVLVDESILSPIEPSLSACVEELQVLEDLIQSLVVLDVLLRIILHLSVFGSPVLNHTRRVNLIAIFCSDE